MMAWYSTRTFGGRKQMISVAIQGFGIVIWDGDGAWRTFAPTESLASMLNARVELALGPAHRCRGPEETTAALLEITGARLLAVECGHGPGECDDAVDLG
jgi:hypothetical protein